MALLMVTKRATSSSTLLGRVLGGGLHPSSGLSCRSFFWRRSRDVTENRPAVADVVTDRENCPAVADADHSIQPHEISITSGFCTSSMKNPLQTSGANGVYEVKEVKEGLFVRMEMPGIDKEDVKVWHDYRCNVFVKAEGKIASSYEESGPVYSAKIKLPSYNFKEYAIEAEIKNGVLRMLIPKSNNEMIELK